MSADFSIFQEINQFAGVSNPLDWLAIFFARFFGYCLILALIFFFIKEKENRKLIFNGFLAAFLARFGFVELIREFYHRSRPFWENQVNLLINYSFQEPSFPSGHAAFFFGLATIFYLNHKKTGLVFFFLAFLIGFFRVFVGVHWPTDILGGAMVGFLSGLIIHRVSKRIKFLKVS